MIFIEGRKIQFESNYEICNSNIALTITGIYFQLRLVFIFNPHLCWTRFPNKFTRFKDALKFYMLEHFILKDFCIYVKFYEEYRIKLTRHKSKNISHVKSHNLQQVCQQTVNNVRIACPKMSTSLEQLVDRFEQAR